MTDVDVAWLAGLFEGEGTCSGSIDKRTLRTYWHLSIRMTDEDVVRRCHEVTGLGRFGMAGNKPFARATKPLFKWGVTSRLELAQLIPLLLPHLGVRRTEKLSECLAWATGEVLAPGPRRGTPWSPARRAAEERRQLGTRTPVGGMS